jgi:hypothetical protein
MSVVDNRLYKLTKLDSALSDFIWAIKFIPTEILTLKVFGNQLLRDIQDVKDHCRN